MFGRITIIPIVNGHCITTMTENFKAPNENNKTIVWNTAKKNTPKPSLALFTRSL